MNIMSRNGWTLTTSTGHCQRVVGACPRCGATSGYWYYRKQHPSNGGWTYKAYCPECGWSSRLLPTVDKARGGTAAQATNRLNVLKRDGNRCVICGDTKRLEVHHIIPVSVDSSLAMETGNMVCLCHACHEKAHTTDRIIRQLVNPR